MARGPVITVSLALVALAAALVWWLVLRGGNGAGGGDRSRVGARSGPTSRGVNLEAFRADYRARLERARAVAARRRDARGDAGSSTTTADAGTSDGGVKPIGNLLRQLMEPRCILGPGELCALLDETVTDCEAGDAQACLAVGQYLEDTPPRPLMARSFFMAACRAGEEIGCERDRVLKDPQAVASCEDDVFRCVWVAYKAHDIARLDEACMLGVADACAVVLYEHDKAGDHARGRAYLEQSCQLGNPMACQELGRRLTSGCVPAPEDDSPCYAPDPAEAAEALLIACEAGFEEACE